MYCVEASTLTAQDFAVLLALVHTARICRRVIVVVSCEWAVPLVVLQLDKP